MDERSENHLLVKFLAALDEIIARVRDWYLKIHRNSDREVERFKESSYLKHWYKEIHPDMKRFTNERLGFEKGFTIGRSRLRIEAFTDSELYKESGPEEIDLACLPEP